MAADLHSQVVAALNQSLTSGPAMREATNFLGAQERTSGFGFVLLRIVEANTNDLSTRQAAATLFKNFCKKLWSEEDAIPSSDKDAIKANIVRLMIGAPTLVQKQLSEALATISNIDWPDSWKGLLPELVAQLQSAADMSVMLGLLESAAAVFERFRGAYDTDENRYPLRCALDQFGVHLPSLLRMLDGRIQQSLSSSPDKITLAPLLHAQRICINIFYLLSTLDLPDIFEENLEAFMAFFHRYLELKLPMVQASAGDEEAGQLEQMQASVLEVIGLYSEKYDEEFTAYLQTFVQDAWGLLAGTERDRLLSPALDGLVSSALRFLTAVASRPYGAALFEQDAAMRAVLEGVVLPNIRLRTSDVETFEDNPVDFIRGDIEGSDSDTRRRAATDLVRALSKHINAKITPACSQYVDQLLAVYATDKSKNEVDKDAAVALVMAVAVKASTTASGATATNELFNLLDFLRLHVLPELQPGEDINSRPFARAACIKFVASFRTLFGSGELHSLLPLLAPFVNAKSYVVHTYAAGAIEKILLVKDKNATGVSTPRVSLDAVAPLVTTLLSSMFSRMMRSDYGENEYLMRCVLRLVLFSKEHVGALTSNLVAALTALLHRVCTNPSNPSFNHLLFEAIAALMRAVCGSKPESVSDFQALLFPPFQEVLQKDVLEFFPYVFQLFAELLELRPTPAPGQSSLTDQYRALLGPVLTPALWMNKGNVPALTELLASYLLKGGVDLAPQTGQVLAIWQKLLTTKQQEQFSFAILNAAFEGLPLATLQPTLPAVMQLVMGKVQELKQIRVARMFVHTFALASGIHGPALLEGVVATFGAGVYGSVIEAVILATAKHVVGASARKEAAIGLTRVLCESTHMMDTGNPAVARVWPLLLATIVELMGPPPKEHGGAPRKINLAAALGAAPSLFTDEEEEDATGTETSMFAGEYTVAYSRLVYASNTDRYAFRALPMPPTYLAQSLARLSAAKPGQVIALIGASPVQATVQSMCSSAGVTLA